MSYEPIVKLSDKRGLSLLEEVIDEIEAHDLRTWDQDAWLAPLGGDYTWPEDLRPDVRQTMVPAVDCGTMACLFGHVVFKAGARMYVRDDGIVDSSHVIVPDTGLALSIRRYAEDLLNLPSDLAAYLSDGLRTWAETLAFRDAWRIDAEAGPEVFSARDAVLEREEFE